MKITAVSVAGKIDTLARPPGFRRPVCCFRRTTDDVIAILTMHLARIDDHVPIASRRRNLMTELAKEGHQVGPTVVGDLLRGIGYML
jgi:hypothetical protein